MPARLAQHLVARGLLSVERAQEALRQHAVVGGGFDTVLLEHAYLSEAALLGALGEVSGAKPIHLGDFEPNVEVAGMIPPKIADRLTVVPLSVDGNTLHVACAYPQPRKELEEIAFLLGKELELWVAVEVRIRDWLNVLYRTPLTARFLALLATVDPNRPLPAPAPTPTPAAAAPTPAPSQHVEEVSLEDALTRDMVERIARTVAEEPIPLEVVKKRPAAPPAPQESAAPAPGHPQRAGTETAAPAPPPAQATPPAPTSAPPAPSQPSPSAAPARPAAPASAPPRPASKAAPWATAPVAQRPAPTPAPAPAQPPPAAAPPPPQPTAAARAALEAPPASSALAAATTERPDRDVVPDWTLEQARAALKQAHHDRERIIDVALRFARRTFDFSAAFAVMRGSAVGWDVRGDNADFASFSQISFPLDATSVFRTVAMTRGSYVGPLPPDSFSAPFLQQMGRAPRSVFLYPVEVKARLVAILYGDSGQKPVSQRKLSDLLLLCQDLPSAFQELIVHRKKGSAAAAPITRPSELFTPPANTSLGWTPGASPELKGLGRAAGMPMTVIADVNRPPPDFTPILNRLTGPDAVGRARAIAELSRTPEPSSKFLAEHFPGPSAWSRLPVVELPEADELGPIPGALARLGRPAAVALAPLLDSPDADVRYLALLTAGNLPYGEIVDGVLRGLFDLEPDISSAARAAATAIRRVPRFDAAMKDLRQELAARDAVRRTLAARALGALRDKEAIEGLIGLTASSDQMCAVAAGEALRDITKATFGAQPRLWSAWWAENRGRRRVDWLVAALRHPADEIRASSIDELSAQVGDNFGYAFDAPPEQREEATRRWESALAQDPRVRRLD